MLQVAGKISPTILTRKKTSQTRRPREIHNSWNNNSNRLSRSNNLMHRHRYPNEGIKLRRRKREEKRKKATKVRIQKQIVPQYLNQPLHQVLLYLIRTKKF
jgi:hypothetical protein